MTMNIIENVKILRHTSCAVTTLHNCLTNTKMLPPPLHEEAHDYLKEGCDEESRCNEPESAGTDQATQSLQHCTPSGAGATTDSRRRIIFNLKSATAFLSSESDD